ncbi:hypothetical protein A8F94_19080 [Bacillus sp. FJAT-27225]|uniref:DUF5658 family protein n=1 Tax=Bacillus sp. FJAT-27225 TaxID=1743144 RepID=UPI00080C2620|nr:DUF5658 family protein [Bacillus sp. FJAT-27225]OCA83214.1 hypothetical protein A8F94_19080 [Bacillus sp. FJAT-27225]
MKKWGYLLAALNFFDGICTYIGLKFYLIEESNPVLAWMPPERIVGLKALLSLALLYLVFRVELKKPVFKYSLLTGNGIYSLLTVLHLYWIGLANST